MTETYSAKDIEVLEGLEPVREISLVRAAGRSSTRAAQAFLDFARGRIGGA